MPPVCSIKWNYNSPTFNREAGIIVDHPEAARYFAAMFEDDWVGSLPHGVRNSATADYLKIGLACLAVTLRVIIYWRRRDQ